MSAQVNMRSYDYIKMLMSIYSEYRDKNVYHKNEHYYYTQQ